MPTPRPTTWPGPFPSSAPHLASIYHASRPAKPHYNSPPSHLIFFIPGNPGLVSYYDTFLAHIAKRVPTASVLGVDHAGFSGTGEGGWWGKVGLGGWMGAKRVYTLAEQVQMKREMMGVFWEAEKRRWEAGGEGAGRMENETRMTAMGGSDSGYGSATASGAATPLQVGMEMRNRGGAEFGIVEAEGGEEEEDNEGFNPKIVLIGHSMGSWLLLETLTALSSFSPSPSSTSSPTPIPTPHLAILLTPTIIDISLSPQGKALTPIITHPLGYHIAQATVTAISIAASCIPGFTSVAAWASGNTAEHVSATLRPWVVRQMVGLAAEEMKVISKERWGFDVEEGAKRVVERELKGLKGTETKMVWFFAERDGWVGEGVVERVEAWGVGRVLRDKTGVGHAFSLRHAEEVAEVVRGIVEVEVGL
ncbi:hypothetical protein EX30DRAFT_366424 [Ascodesmis nigricans]|uniref:AB hydrolase-1 domain-containing protein n=1 Tax=Ascodesmis nigricans TaxID=341454 RepID=A0A4S2MRM9_9PEZI|nr:hypothetical protein EX30DRAFT_366424 [Ascodesmis nigricans]